jgi:hypothetical protein
MANKPNNPALWSRAKSMAKQKFDVYPSAYANGWAAKWYKSKGGTWRKAEYGMEVMGDGGTPDNPGFRALPPAVQQQIIDNMAQGGQKMPPEIARARFAAAGNLDQMSDYGYRYGGSRYMQQGGQEDQIMQIIQAYAQMNQIDPKQLLEQFTQMAPEQQKEAIMQMAQTLQQGSASQQQPDMTQAAMAYGGYTTGIFAEGGEPNGGMALGQMAAVADKMSKLRQFISPDQNLDPWIASKLAVMDHSADAIADYMMYNPEAQGGGEEVEEEYEQEEMPEMGRGGYTVTRSNDRKGKTHKVTGPDGTVKYFGDSKLGQHPKDPERKAAFYARHKKNLAGNPYFRAFARATWKEGGTTFSGNAWYQTGGQKVVVNNPDDPRLAAYNDSLYKYNSGNRFAKFLNKYQQGEDTLNDAYSKYETLRRANKELATNQAIGKTSYATTYGGGSPIMQGEYNVFQKPQQEVVYLPEIFTDNPNDPRLLAYNDSLARYNSSRDIDSFVKKYQKGSGNLDQMYKQLNTLEKRNREIPSNKAKSKVNYVTPFGGGSPLIKGSYNMFEKPVQPVRYYPEDFKNGGIHLDPAKKGTFKAQATRMGMGVQEAASAILNAPEGKYSPAMRKKANFAKNFAKQMGGLVEGDIVDVTPEQLQMLKQGGYNFEIID